MLSWNGLLQPVKFSNTKGLPAACSNAVSPAGGFVTASLHSSCTKGATSSSDLSVGHPTPTVAPWPTACVAPAPLLAVDPSAAAPGGRCLPRLRFPSKEDQTAEVAAVPELLRGHRRLQRCGRSALLSVASPGVSAKIKAAQTPRLRQHTSNASPAVRFRIESVDLFPVHALANTLHHDCAGRNGTNATPCARSAFNFVTIRASTPFCAGGNSHAPWSCSIPHSLHPDRPQVGVDSASTPSAPLLGSLLQNRERRWLLGSANQSTSKRIPFADAIAMADSHVFRRTLTSCWSTVASRDS
eukprot:208002-Rhodomonas_salina.1